MSREIQDSLWGAGSELVLIHSEGSRTSIKLFENQPFLFIHSHVHNSSDKARSISTLEVLNAKVSINGQALKSFGTGGLEELTNGTGSYTVHALVNGDSRNGLVSGSLTHNQGVGTFFPSEGGGLKANIDFGNFEIDAKNSRDTDTLIFGFFEDARIGLETYADIVAKQEGVKLAPLPNVYCTWYHKRASDEATLQRNTEFADQQLKPFGLNVMQIDDEWQSLLPKDFEHEGEIPLTGPIKAFIDTNENYPSGMAHTAKMIDSHGMVPGIWFMPFAGNYANPYFDHDVFAKTAEGEAYHDARWSGTCVDATSPKGAKFIYDRTKRIHDWGYRYFKIDGLHTGMPSKNIYVSTGYKDQNFGDSILHDSKSTHIQAYRKGLQILRDAAPDTFVLGCNVSQNMMSMGPAFGLLEAMRIGPDNGNAGKGSWDQVTLGAWHGTNLYFLNKRVWHNDPDPIYVREQNPME
ncbi:MAG: hypothetical protein AAF226_14840, partial [Verrucomicrobiota bacterium]